MVGISSRSLKSSNRLKYGGKEEQREKFSDESGLDFVDFGARMLNTQIGRWYQVDPLSELLPAHSAYTYVSNNPVALADPDGRIFSGSTDLVDDYLRQAGKLSKKLENSISNLKEQMNRMKNNGKDTKDVEKLLSNLIGRLDNINTGVKEVNEMQASSTEFYISDEFEKIQLQKVKHALTCKTCE